MNSGIVCSAVTPHTPRMGIESKAPAFVAPVIAGSYQMGEALRAMKPDVFIVNSSHWISTFNWYATCQAEHRGMCVADEAPDLIPGVPYRRRGMPRFAEAIIDEVKALGLPIYRNETEYFTWDYGSYVPLHYLDPGEIIPAVLIPTCISANLDECMKVGAAIDRAARKIGVRAIFLASCSLSHKLVRGPEQWPAPERIETDRAFIEMLCEGHIAQAKRWFPEYCEKVVAEVGGRDLAAMLGCLDEHRGPYIGKQFGAYGQSSGSGNTNVAVWHSDSN
jgi:3,4-dihydroxyphenylacetate 2,3-dioxygenase